MNHKYLVQCAIILVFFCTLSGLTFFHPNIAHAVDPNAADATLDIPMDTSPNDIYAGTPPVDDTYSDPAGSPPPVDAPPDALPANRTKQSILDSTKNLFTFGGYQTIGPAGSVGGVIGYIISGLLLMVGSIFMIIIIYSGVRWMLSGGNKETVDQARKRIVRASIGLAIVLGAWIITRFVLTGLLNPNRGSGSWFSRQP